ncbi:annexin A13-like isoform X3 [Venturia canescens]|nr:annexin A13-like isoform X3 [Venturia canescens]
MVLLGNVSLPATDYQIIKEAGHNADQIIPKDNPEISSGGGAASSNAEITSSDGKATLSDAKTTLNPGEANPSVAETTPSNDKTARNVKMIPLRSTIIVPEKLDLTDDANLLYEELEHNDLDRFLRTFMLVMGNRTGSQREEILTEIEYWYNDNAYNSVVSAWKRGNFGVDVLLFGPAKRIYSSELERGCSDENANMIIEVLLSLNKHDRNETLEEYKFNYDVEFLDDFKKFNTSEYVRAIVHTLCNDATSGGSVVNIEEPCKTAERLVTILEGSKKVNLTALNSILLTMSNDEVRAIDREFFTLTNRTMKAALRAKSIGLYHVYRNTMEFIRDPHVYFAKKLNKAITKKEPYFGTINRIVIGRSEVDLGNIKSTYHDIFKSHLADDLKKITTGRYQLLLLTLLGEYSWEQHPLNYTPIF